MKSLSIIMPVYNAGSSIQKAIESVIRQKTEDMELIVIDGGSSDNTMDVVRRYQENIDYFVSERDSGYADALNKGIAKANGEYYMMLAGDDELIDGAIKNAMGSLRQGTDVWCGTIVEKTKYGYRFNKSYPDLTRLYYECSLRHPASIFRKETVVNCGGYDTSLKCAADRELFLHLVTMGASFQIEDIPMVVFSMNGMSILDPSKLAIPEDRIVSAKYGLTEEQLIDNENSITKTLLRIHRTEKIKVFLSKLGILPIICRIIGKPGSCLDHKTLKKLNIR